MLEGDQPIGHAAAAEGLGQGCFVGALRTCRGARMVQPVQALAQRRRLRGRSLRRAAAIRRERNGELAELETLDTGKPVCETATVDIISGAEVMEYFAGLAPSIHGQHIDLPPEAFATIRRELRGSLRFLTGCG